MFRSKLQTVLGDNSIPFLRAVVRHFAEAIVVATERPIQLGQWIAALALATNFQVVSGIVSFPALIADDYRRIWGIVDGELKRPLYRLLESLVRYVTR